jgi:uncharacterized membrane-anchored protein
MRIKLYIACFGLLFLFAIDCARAQQKPAVTSRDSLWDQIEKLDWKLGPTQGAIAGVATISVPQGSAFLESSASRRFLELQGNIGADGTYTFAPSDVRWFAVFAFDQSGYVRDGERIDPDELLATLKKNNVEVNEERKRRGLQTLVLEDWYVVPHYDVQTKRLEWGTKLREESGAVAVNYTVRLLGRSGVMRATLVSDPNSLDQDTRAFKAALAGFDFDQGQKYSEFRAGDKVAQYGLAALIVGGASAVAVKSGAFKAIGKFLIFGVFGAIAAAWAAIKNLFSRKRNA